MSKDKTNSTIAKKKPTKKATTSKDPKVKAVKKPAQPKKPTKAKAPAAAPVEEITQVKPALKPCVILQVLPEIKSGGVERGTLEIAKAGIELGHKMLIASKSSPKEAQFPGDKTTYITLPLASKNPLTIIANIRRLHKIIKKYDVDIVHARSRAPAWSAYFAAKIAGCHFVTTFHGVYSIGSSIKKLYNSVMTKGEIVIAVSDFIKNHITGNYKIKQDKIRVIQRGVDLSQFSTEKVDKARSMNIEATYHIELSIPTILLPGRFTRWKGQECLIDAIEILKNKYNNDNFICVLAGYDKKHENYYKEIEQRIIQKGLVEYANILGEVKDMPALYSLADIVVSNSIAPEAFGRVAIEGQAMGKMVIATNHGGSCESVIDNQTGWLISPNNPEELAEKLNYLLHITQDEKHRIAQQARENIEKNFSLQNMINKTFEVYSEVLK